VTGSASIRTELYDLFVRYQDVQKELGFYDLCDVVFAAHAGLVVWKAALGGTRALPIHAIFVDEVQDCSQGLIKTFLSACSDPNGLFLAGDTCQTIAKGVGGFRFEDLRSMFYAEREHQLSGEGDEVKLFSGDSRLVAVPPLLQLGTNYRSHNGVLRCANVLVSLLVELFPSSVDRMRLEESKTPGERPMLLPDVTPLELFYLIHRGKESTAPAEFGANQCIIVRNLETQEKVRIDFPKALVMTVEECKGLEFEDCIIYNFFSDSDAGARVLWLGVLSWAKKLLLKVQDSNDSGDMAVKEMRGVLGSLADADGESKLLECAFSSSFRGSVADKNELPAFEPSKYYIMCEELKALYVSVTRAKKRVVFFDEDEAKRAPFFELLERAQVANKISLDARQQLASEGTSSLAQASTPQEWRAQGSNLFDNRKFELAAQCFEKSKDPLEQAEAAACCDIAKALLNETPASGSAGKLAMAAEGLLFVYSQYGRAVHAEVAAKCLVSAGVSTGPLDAGASFLALASSVFLALGRPRDAASCMGVKETGESGDALVNSLGIRYAQLMGYSWTCYRLKMKSEQQTSES